MGIITGYDRKKHAIARCRYCGEEFIATNKRVTLCHRYECAQKRELEEIKKNKQRYKKKKGGRQ